MSVQGRQNLSDQQLLDELQRLADEFGHTPTRREMNELGRYSATFYRTRFGSWNNAVTDAGLDAHTCGQRKTTDRELVEDLYRIVNEHACHYLTSGVLDEHGKWSPETYRKHFGSMDAVRAVVTPDRSDEFGVVTRGGQQ